VWLVPCPVRLSNDMVVFEPITAFSKHYQQVLSIATQLLGILRDLFQFFRSMSSSGWLKKIPRSKKITAQFEQFDADIMAVIGSSSLPVIRPIHANMAVCRKYLDGTGLPYGVVVGTRFV